MSKNYHTFIKGTGTELLAAVWLLEQGYHVYRALMPAGPSDIIAIKDDEVIKVDVKHRKSSNGRYAVSILKDGDSVKKSTRVLYYLADRKSFVWYEDYLVEFPHIPKQRQLDKAHEVSRKRHAGVKRKSLLQKR